MDTSFLDGGAFPIPQMWNVPKRFFECSSGALSRRIGQNSDLVATQRSDGVVALAAAAESGDQFEHGVKRGF